MKQIPGGNITRLGSNTFTNNAYGLPVLTNENQCPRCGSDLIIKKGYRERGEEKNDPAQRYMCKECHYKFTLNPIRKTFIKNPVPVKQPAAPLTTYFKYRK